MTNNCTAQDEAWRFKQPYVNATARQARASTFVLTCGERKEWLDAQGKRHNVLMPA